MLYDLKKFVINKREKWRGFYTKQAVFSKIGNIIMICVRTVMFTRLPYQLNWGRYPYRTYDYYNL